MKKWILVLVLYVLGYLFIQDVFSGLEWIRDMYGSVTDIYHSLGYYFNVVLMLIPFMFLLVNYFILRIRAKSPAFTFVNAMFVTVFLLVLLIGAVTNGYNEGFKDVFEGIVDPNVWQELWDVVPLILILLVVNFISGIVISEAKSKGSYLTAEFIYLFSGIIVMLFSTMLLLI